MAVVRSLTAGLLVLGVASALVAFACTSFESDEPASLPDGGPVITVDAASATDEARDAHAEAAPPVDAAPDGACKAGTDGRPVVRAGGVCIDVKEVTIGDFLKFLQTSPKEISDAGACGSNVIAVDTDCIGTNGRSDQPRTCIDWCDAAAYCRWAGKHLCGEVAGGPLRPADVSTLHDAWFVACAGADGGRKYPYGSVYDGGVCTTEQGLSNDVGAKPDCRTPEGVLDLSGNASEWLDSCDSELPLANCSYHDSDFSRSVSATCAFSHVLKRDESRTEIGFRCCSD